MSKAKEWFGKFSDKQKELESLRPPEFLSKGYTKPSVKIEKHTVMVKNQQGRLEPKEDVLCAYFIQRRFREEDCLALGKWLIENFS